MDKIRTETGGFSLRRYGREDAALWDAFVEASRNGTFLLQRPYMDYHSDRFADHSLIAEKNGRTVALLPANMTSDGVLHSHQGLTYGGWILPEGHLDGEDVLTLFRLLVDYMKEQGMTALDYKPIPWVYATTPSQEDEYALFRMGAAVTEVTLDSAAPLGRQPQFNKLFRRHLKKALTEPYRVIETEDVDSWMEMLRECLAERHDVAPVHSAAEMKLLKERFPWRIRFFSVVGANDPDQTPEAGVCVYDTGRVAHLQYIATTEKGRRLNLLVLLIHQLMTQEYAARQYLDFGISTEEGGRYLNAGLLRQKFSFGATGVTCRRYRLDVAAGGGSSAD